MTFEIWMKNALIITLLWAGLFTTIAKAFIGLREPTRKQFTVCIAGLIIGMVIVHIASFILWG